MKKLFLALLAGGLASALSAAPKPPKLVLTVVIDQFRFDYLRRFQKDYNSGFVRIMTQGAVFTNAHQVHFPTVTAVGHSAVMTGATPSSSGIVGNDWYDRETCKAFTSVSDASTTLLGGAPGKTGSSPRRLLVTTIGDELKMQGREAKVIGVSIKDRSAILPAGHAADGAYWFDSATKHWVTSTYYTPELPKWVSGLNDSDLSKRFRDARWLPFDAKDKTAKPFCTMAKNDPEVKACRSLEASPWGNELTEEFAEKALVEEKLGKHGATDVLTVSFSSNDYVGHAYGPDSPEVRDISIRTDRLLGKLLDFVDRQLGPGNTVVVLTADHGVSPVPEVNQSRKLPGGRLSEPDLLATMTKVLTAKYGEGKWVVGMSGPSPYLNRELIAEKKLDQAEVEQTAATALAAMPHILRVYTRTQLMNGQMANDYSGRDVQFGFNAQRSGDIFIVPEPYYLFEKSGTSHGMPYNYDSHVPVIFMGPGFKPGEYPERVGVVDIAPTLASILGVEYPSASIGRVLNEALR